MAEKEWTGEEPPAPETDEIEWPGEAPGEPPLDGEILPYWEFQERQAERERERRPLPPKASLATPPNGERPRLTVIGDVQSKRIDWLEEQLIARGMLTGLLAPGGTGKGLYGIHLSVKLALREERTLFLCSEDALDYIVRPRFEAANCDAQLAHSLDVESETGSRELHFPGDLELLQQAIDELAPALVIIDPMMGYIEANLDLAKNNQMRAILQPLIGLARESGTAIIPVYHLGKDRARGAIGTVAFEDSCRQVLTVARDDEDEDVRHLELTKTNVGRTGYGRKLRIVEVPVEIDGETVPMAKLVDEGRSAKSVHTLLQTRGAHGPDPGQKEAARSAISAILVEAAGKPVPAGETRERLIEELGVSVATINRAEKELREEGLSGAAPVRDEYGAISGWEWFAKTTLLLGAGEA